MSEVPNPLEQERVWIEQSKTDIAYFRPLYDKYHDPLHRYFVRRTDDYALAKDLCSSTFFKALDKLHQFTWQGKPFGAWLFKIAANELRKHYRDAKPVYVLELDKMDCAPGVDIEEMDWQPILIKALDDLPEADLRILELKFFEHQSFKEISALLEISESAAKMRVYRLLSNLRTRMESNDEA